MRDKCHGRSSKPRERRRISLVMLARRQPCESQGRGLQSSVSTVDRRDTSQPTVLESQHYSVMQTHHKFDGSEDLVLDDHRRRCNNNQVFSW